MKHEFQRWAGTVLGDVHIPVVLPQISRTFRESRPHNFETQQSREGKIRLRERDEERERIACELHDTLFQGFLTASPQLVNAVDEISSDSPAKQSLNRILRRFSQAIDEGCAVLRGLRVPLMTNAGLEQALLEMIRELSSAGARVQLIATGKSKQLKPEIQQEVCLIAREALSNAFRHSLATLIEVEIEYQLRNLRLAVRDNGRGMDSRAFREHRQLHWGFQGMQERAKILGARLHLWSRPGAGTEVEVSIPLSFVANDLARKATGG